MKKFTKKEQDFKNPAFRLAILKEALYYLQLRENSTRMASICLSIWDVINTNSSITAKTSDILESSKELHLFPELQNRKPLSEKNKTWWFPVDEFLPRYRILEEAITELEAELSKL